MAPPAPTLAEVCAHPLAAWVEETFGLETEPESDRFVRRPPVTFADGVKKLAEATGLAGELCAERLLATLNAGNTAITDAGDPVFAFRFHQFLSSGSSVFATIEPPVCAT